MKTNNGNLPAAPTIYADMAANGQREIYCTEVGLTKREMFAMAAMQGILANSSNGMSYAARDAVLMADELLAELEKAKCAD